MQKQRTLSFNCSNSQYGTAIIGALVMVAIIAMVVGVMLSSSNYAIRQSRDRILYEEAYQAAVSGTHVARAWMINPALGSQMSGNASMEDALEDVMLAAKKMSSDIIESSYTLASAEPADVKSTWFASIGEATPLSDGRYVLYTFPQDAGRVASFVNDQDNKKFNTSLFQGGNDGDHVNYVDVLRITTPGTTNDTSCSLRETSLIVEALGVAEYAGTKKERLVQQRVLVYPNDTALPLLSASQAIITQSGLTIGGSSHINIHWGPVITKEDIEILGMSLTKPADPTLPWVIAPSDGPSQKFNGAGTFTYNSPDFSGSEVIDKWLSFETGVEGELMAGSGTDPLFKDIALEPGQQVTDFFAQLMNGEFATLNPTLTAAELQMAGKYMDAGTRLDNEENYNGVLEQTESGAWAGALVQGSPEVDQKVDAFFGVNNYDKLKAYAIDHNGYVRVTDDGFVNSLGNPLYVNPATRQMSDVQQSSSWKRLTDLEQISMEALVPANYDSLLDDSIDDRILFVDSEGESVDSPISSAVNISPKFFWKGIMYVNGSLDSAGAGTEPVLILRTPDEYTAAAPDGGHPVGSMLIEGILIVNGTVTSRGNMSIYGTLAGKGTIDLGGNPSVFYNPANGNGRLKDTTGNPAQIRLVAGRFYETAATVLQ